MNNMTDGFHWYSRNSKGGPDRRRARPCPKRFSNSGSSCFSVVKEWLASDLPTIPCRIAQLSSFGHQLRLPVTSAAALAALITAA